MIGIYKMNPLLNLVLLKTFVTVAETGNFTVASQHLNSTQSTL
ncbi:LysR family transcriptional regulator, partial [Providencia sp. PROV112]